MSPETAYLVTGAILCAALAAVWAWSFSRRRKRRIEAPKYTMLEDDED